MVMEVADNFKSFIPFFPEKQAAVYRIRDRSRFDTTADLQRFEHPLQESTSDLWFPMPKSKNRPPHDSNYDEPWKSFIINHFYAFLTFYFPKMADVIDWSVPPVFDFTEVSQFLGKAKRRNKFIDVVVQVTLLTGEKQIILLHFEVQTKYGKKLGRRLYLLTCGLQWQFPDFKIASLVVRTDLHQKWQPLEYAFAAGGFSSQFTFPTCKISERLATDWSEDFSLPAMVARAQIEALKTTSDAEARYEAKKRLIRMLYERHYERDEVLDILRYLDWMMHLSDDLERKLRGEIRTFKSEKFPEMTKYVTSWERFAKQEGLAEGLEKGLEEGLEKGLEKGREEKVELAIRLLQKRFGKLTHAIQAQIAALSAKLLDELFDAVLEFASKEEIGEWLKARS